LITRSDWLVTVFEKSEPYLILSIGSKQIVAFAGYFPDGELPAWCYVLPAVPVLTQLLCLVIALANTKRIVNSKPVSAPTLS
ncbi:MAG: hypothetical protein ACTH82_07510, partial [Glutamicibacter ardleyensis]